MRLEYFIGLVGAFVFVLGFFPISSNIGEFDNDLPKEIKNISLKINQQYISNITKTVLVVIDALRIDFGINKLMPLTSKITKENGCIIEVSVETPTVTLPRIKALTTGSIPQFMDIVMNLANAQSLKDSLIHSAQQQQKKIVFYGDNTWLKLFPNQFFRYEGTNSFFVKDFKEVDDNVTRNLNLELQKDDWDILILHYLGLDHIGHVYGPFHSLIPIKLKEMDEIVFKIYKKLSSKYQNTLLVITSDHGMRDSGGHGGSSLSETRVPLFMIGPKCHNGALQQSDVPVNLAVLLGLQIPSTSIGKVNPELFEFNLEKKLYVLRYNLLLLKQKSDLCDQDFDVASQLHLNYLENNLEINALKAVEIYTNCLQKLSQNLLHSSVQQNVVLLVVGILTLGNVLMSFILSVCFANHHINKLNNILLLIIPIFSLLQPSFSTFLILILLILILRNIFLIKISKLTNLSVILLIIKPSIFFSSSFVEEEHQLWYFIYSILIIFQIIYYIYHQNFKYCLYCVLLATNFRLIRILNSTGDQWANYPDLSDWFIKPDNYAYYLLFIASSICYLYFSMNYIDTSNKKSNFCNLLGLLCIFIYKVTESILLAQLCWLLIFCHCIIFHRNQKISSWIFIGTLLLKPYNIVLLPFCIFSHLIIKNIVTNTELLVLWHICLENLLFFAQGHSNSLASVDVSVGYVGLYTYQPLIVIFQVLLHTYTFPVLCHSLILRNNQYNDEKVWNVLFLNRYSTYIVISMVTFLLRQHLFIWSVFAPKLFIESVHVLFLFFECCCYFLTNYVVNLFKKKLYSFYIALFLT